MKGPDNSYVQEPQELTDLIDTSKLIQKVFAKTNGHRQNFRHYKEKSFERNTSAAYSQGNPSRLLDQPLFQRSLFVFVSRISYQAKDPL